MVQLINDKNDGFADDLLVNAKIVIKELKAGAPPAVVNRRLPHVARP